MLFGIVISKGKKTKIDVKRLTSNNHGAHQIVHVSPNISISVRIDAIWNSHFQGKKKVS